MVVAQSAAKKTIVQQAHDKQLLLENFENTKQNNYKVKVFTVDERAMNNQVHHWFVQVLETNDLFVNFGNIKLSGYLKRDKQIKFNYMNPVTRMCNEGKYVVGFVNVKHPGIYVLNIEINNFGIIDTITTEIEIPEERNINP